ncbi:MAG: hypothetical protein SWC40_12270, partial [Thermodesulfobacteriota bacterium]|nr:hypothetical protein [Thermodesulfobacteriota bacterium]
AGAWERGETELMRLLLQGHLDLPQRVTLDVVLKDPHRNTIDGDRNRFQPVGAADRLGLVLRLAEGSSRKKAFPE